MGHTLLISPAPAPADPLPAPSAALLKRFEKTSATSPAVRAAHNELWLTPDDQESLTWGDYEDHLAELAAERKAGG